MKKFLLLVITLILGLNEVYAYDVKETFYYDEEKVKGMWINRERDSVLMSGLPFFLKRVADDAIVYCLEPFIVIKEEIGYEGYYELNNLFDISDETLNKIRLLAYFGYGYPEHRADKWYGITQYLIWKAIDTESEIYFADERYGKKIDKYEKEIAEIENLIADYEELLKYHNQSFVFSSYEELTEFKKGNIFLENIGIGTNTIMFPLNTNMQDKEIFFYHEVGQDLYMPSVTFDSDIVLTVNVKKKVTLKKWYGSGKYKVEEGAVFELYKDDLLQETVTTNALGEAYLDLNYGDYKIVQIKGKEGYHFIEDFVFTIDDNTVDLVDLYDKKIYVKVPDTYKMTSWLSFALKVRENKYGFI